MALNILRNVSRSITTKLLVFVFFIYLIVAAGTTLNQIHFEYNHAQQRIQYELSLYEKILNPILADALWEFREDDIQQTIEGLLNSNTIVGMSIYASGQYQWHGGLTSIDKGQKTFGSYDAKTGALQETQATSINPKMISYAFDITAENDAGAKTTLAQCQVYSTQDVLMRQIQPSISLLIFNQLLEIASLWFFFMILGYTYVTKPLIALSIGMSQVKEGCYDEPDLSSHSLWRTELDTFIDDFKDMVSTLRKTDLNLKNTQASLQSTVDAMPSMILGIDQNGKIFEWNKAMENYAEIAFSAVVGEDYLQVLPHFKKFTESIEQSLKTQKPITIHDVPFKVKQQNRVFELLFYPMSSVIGDGVIVRLDDITEKKQLQTMMIQNEKMSTVGGLAAGMAHEINNPLGIIVQNTQNVIRRLQPTLEMNQDVAKECDLNLEQLEKYMQIRKIDEFLQAIRDAGDRASKIVSNLLHFSRHSSSEKEADSLRNMIDIALDLSSTDYELKKIINFSDIKVVKNIPTDLPSVLISPIEIQQVLLNLIKNAAYAMKDQKSSKELIFNATFNNRSVSLEIKDTGSGIPDAVKHQVFEPFFTTKPVNEGTGLGLSVSYAIIVQSHHGSIQFESEVDKGTSFLITLPRSTIEEMTTNPESNAIAVSPNQAVEAAPTQTDPITTTDSVTATKNTTLDNESKN